MTSAGDYAAAAKFYVQCEHPEDFAAMMSEWAQLGYPGEVDLFLARGVLQYVALARASPRAVTHGATCCCLQAAVPPEHA